MASEWLGGHAAQSYAAHSHGFEFNVPDPDPPGRPEDNWMFEYREDFSDWYCLACSAYATDDHLKTPKHINRRTDKTSYKWVMAERAKRNINQSSSTSAAASSGSSGPTTHNSGG